MPGLLRRLWAKRRPRAVTIKPEPRTETAGPDAAERLEDARRRLKQTIPSPQDEENPIPSPQLKQTPPSSEGAENPIPSPQLKQPPPSPEGAENLPPE